MKIDHQLWIWAVMRAEMDTGMATAISWLMPSSINSLKSIEETQPECRRLERSAASDEST
jgi:hypothetical protein